MQGIQLMSTPEYDTTFYDLGAALRGATTEGPFGQIPTVRKRPVVDHSLVHDLPLPGRAAVEEVRAGEQRWALLLEKGRAYLVMARPGGAVEDGRRYGYVVHAIDLPPRVVPRPRGLAPTRLAGATAAVLALVAGVAAGAGYWARRDGTVAVPAAGIVAAHAAQATTLSTADADAEADTDVELADDPADYNRPGSSELNP
jgi:hypothetical protein